MGKDERGRGKFKVYKGEGKGKRKRRSMGLPSLVSLVREKGLQERLLRNRTGWEVEKTVRRILVSLDSAEEKALTIATFVYRELGYNVRCDVGGTQIFVVRPLNGKVIRQGYEMRQEISSGETRGTFMITKFDETFTEAEIARFRKLLEFAKFELIEW